MNDRNIRHVAVAKNHLLERGGGFFFKCPVYVDNQIQKPMQINETLDATVLAALKRLEETQDPDALTLEEVMMCRYKLPCWRIAPGTNYQFRKYRRGSVLVYEHVVILILLPGDNTTHFPFSRVWVVGKKRQYKGVLPGSSFYTNGGTRLLVEDGLECIQSVREMMRQSEEYYETHPEQKQLLAWENSEGKLNDHRCSEAFYLAGGLSARRMKRIFSEA